MATHRAIPRRGLFSAAAAITTPAQRRAPRQLPQFITRRLASSTPTIPPAAAAAASSSLTSTPTIATTTTTKTIPVKNPSSSSTVRTIAFVTGLALSGLGLYIYATDTRAFFHRHVVPPLLRTVYPDAEEAHEAAVSAMKHMHRLNLHPRERGSSSDLAVTVFGTRLANPLAISAGLDKHAEIPDALFALGASIVEVGGCTPRPQDGNPKPRMFRIPGIDGLINRYGLNSLGADHMAMVLRERARRFGRTVGLDEAGVLNGEAGVPPGSLAPGRLLLVQIAKNKDTDEADPDAVARDYVYCVRQLGRYADVLVVNVSSPNTPGLRDLQATEPLTRLLSAVVEEAQRTDRAQPPRVMVKVSPDEDEDAQMQGIVQAVWSSGVDGLIVGNTTKRRGAAILPPGVAITHREQATLTETGGYSGPMMLGRTVDLVRQYRKMLDNTSASQRGTEQKVIFATGGITNGRDALQVLNAGASVAMVYTGLVYGGAGTITRMKSEMRAELKTAGV